MTSITTHLQNFLWITFVRGSSGCAAARPAGREPDQDPRLISFHTRGVWEFAEFDDRPQLQPGQRALIQRRRSII